MDAVVTTRHGGVSHTPFASLNLGLHVGDNPDAVVHNRATAAQVISLGLDDLVFCQQTHHTSVAVVDTSHRGRGTRSDTDALEHTDALVTTQAGVGLVVMVADCVPMVIVDPTARVLACVHAGWRGTTGGIAATAVAAMTTLGADPARMVVGIGPSIGPDSYQVGPDVADAVTTAFGDDTGAYLIPDGPGHWKLDLPGANAGVLHHAGVPETNIDTMDTDTTDPNLFSHRRHTPTGRFAAMARLTA